MAADRTGIPWEFSVFRLLLCESAAAAINGRLCYQLSLADYCDRLRRNHLARKDQSSRMGCGSAFFCRCRSHFNKRQRHSTDEYAGHSAVHCRRSMLRCVQCAEQEKRDRPASLHSGIFYGNGGLLCTDLAGDRRYCAYVWR